jgi:hypothetical protein
MNEVYTQAGKAGQSNSETIQGENDGTVRLDSLPSMLALGRGCLERFEMGHIQS